MRLMVNFPMCFQTKNSFVQTSLSIWNIAFHDPLGLKAYKNESLDFCHSRLYKQPSQPDLVRLSEIYINKKLRKGLSCSSSVAFICSLNMPQNIQVVFFCCTSAHISLSITLISRVGGVLTV